MDKHEYLRRLDIDNVEAITPKIPLVILAPGPGLNEFIMPVDTAVLVVNKAVEFWPSADWWLVADWWATKTPWFYAPDKHFKHNRLFSMGMAMHSEWCKYPHAGVCATFELEPKIAESPEPFIPPERKFRPDGTSVGIAMQIMFRLGWRDFILAGCDMTDDIYFDGTSAVRGSPHAKYIPYLNGIIRWVESYNGHVVSMTPTALDVEVRG